MSQDSYDEILVPFDNSKFSEKALEKAMEFAKVFGSTLHLATIIDVSSVVPPGIISTEQKKTIDQIKAHVRESAGKILYNKARECQTRGIEVKCSIVDGIIVNELLKMAQKNKIGLIVIGSKGLSGFSRLVSLGSVSRKISELADCPVMIVR